MDDWKELENEFSDVANQVGQQFDIFAAVNKVIQDSEVFDPGVAKKLKNRGYMLQEIGEQLQDIGYLVRLVAQKAENHD